MIRHDLAGRFIEQIRKYTDYNVNIMDENGVIIASCSEERVGQYHEVAHNLLLSGESISATTDSSDFAHVLPGINMVIEAGGKREGVVGLTGNPDEVRPVALVVKMSIEAMLRYEQQQEEARLRQNRKERFLYFLTQVEHAKPEELRQMADELDYPEEKTRIPILAYTKDIPPETALQILRGGSGHTSLDISYVLDPQHFVVFKTFDEKDERLLSDCKYLVGEYLSPLLRWLNDNGKEIVFFVGSFQDRYPRYYFSFQHCKWLERNIRQADTALFFYDYVGSYLQDLVPMRDMQQIFRFLEKQLPEKKKRSYMEMLEVLLQTNFNFSRAAERLYLHKNTLVYRYNNMKDFFGMDPMISSSDRAFLGSFLSYLKRSG